MAFLPDCYGIMSGNIAGFIVFPVLQCLQKICTGFFRFGDEELSVCQFLKDAQNKIGRTV